MANWRDSNQYKRILEILADYWLDEPDEAEVIVNMTFRKADGQEQAKRIVWRNPDMKSDPCEMRSVPFKKLSEVKRKASCF